MERFLRGRLLAAAMVFSTAPLCTITPAVAQVSVDISFDSFHDQLAQYGNWVYSDRWGTVWQPGDVPDDFRPYNTRGHWEYTDDYGWMWVSDYAWGDVVFHYGRWVYDPDDGWLWMPGYVWSPGWVVWRGNNDYLGWMPMPPDDNFLSGRGDIGVSVSWGDPGRYYSDWYGPSYGGGSSLWVFINYGHIGDRDYHRWEARRDQVPVLVNQTTNITNYTVVNNYVVNKSVDVHKVEQFAGHPIRPVAARSVIRNPALIATVAHGEQVRAQMIHVAPRGMGKPNSAPPPPPSIVAKLSDHAVARGSAHHGGPPQHLFTKAALSRPDAASHFRGGPNGQTGPSPQSGPARMQTPPQDNRPQRIAPENDRNASPNGGPRRMAPESGVARHPDRMPDNADNPDNNNMPGREHRRPGFEGAPNSGPGPRNEPSRTSPEYSRPQRIGPENDRAPANSGEQFNRRRERMPESGPGSRNDMTNGPANGPGPYNGGPQRVERPQRMMGPPPESGPPREMRNGPSPRATPPERMRERSAPPERAPERSAPPPREERGGDHSRPEKERQKPPPD